MSEPEEKDPVVTVRDIVEAGFCPGGIVTWMKEHDLSYRDFKAGKYRLSQFLDIDDGYAQQVIRHIKTKQGIQ